MKMPSPRVLALLLLVPLGFGLGLGLKKLRRPSAAPAPSAPDGGPACTDADAEPPALLPDQDVALVLIDGDAPHLTLSVDGRRVVASPTTPQKLRPGRHALKAEADGQDTLSFEFDVAAFRAALIHLEASPVTGLTAFFTGVSWANAPATSPAPLEPLRSPPTAEAVLRRAAQALRANDPRSARAALQLMPALERKQGTTPANPTYRRLLAITQAQFGESPGDEALPPLPEGLRVSWEAARAAEAKRRSDVAINRWNLLTTRLSALLLEFPGAAPGAQSSASSRMADLSASFLDAARQSDVEAQEATLAAGEQTLAELSRKVRATQPTDCAFQAAVTASLRRENPDEPARR